MDQNQYNKMIMNVLNEVKKYYNDDTLYKTPNLNIAAEIEDNIQSEAEAREKYYNLLKIVKDKEDIMQIQEIISDELNHTEILQKLLTKYSKIPPSKD